MDATIMRGRVQEARVGHLATVSPGGRPHVVPCCFVLDEETLYSAVDAKPKSSLELQRLSNLRANSSASLLVDEYSDDWATLWWVRLDGTARIVGPGAERERALVLLTAKYQQYVRDPPPGAVIAIDIVGWRAWP